MNFTSLDDAFPDKPWPKKHPLSSSKHVPEHRDSEKEGRTFPTPQHRGQHAIQKHKKTIDDLTASLPISDDSSENNFNPQKISSVTQREHFSTGEHGPDGHSFAYAPPQYQMASHELKMQKLIEMFDSLQHGQETPGTQDMLLYIFTGVFFIYTFEMLGNIGK
jgi:hypothetical protein